jgi:hypothetical protein
VNYVRIDMEVKRISRGHENANSDNFINCHYCLSTRHINLELKIRYCDGWNIVRHKSLQVGRNIIPTNKQTMNITRGKHAFVLGFLHFISAPCALSVTSNKLITWNTAALDWLLVSQLVREDVYGSRSFQKVNPLDPIRARRIQSIPLYSSPPYLS